MNRRPVYGILETMRTGKKNKAFVPLMLIAIILTGAVGCEVILGRDVDDLSSGGMADAFRLRYVETLRNEASLVSEGYSIAGIRSLPTSSILQPSAVAADATRVYVTNRPPLSRLAIFDRTARSLTIISSPTPTALGEIFLDLASVAVAASGEIFVADVQQGKVFGLDREGNLLLTIGKTGSVVYPAAIAVDSVRQHVYVADKHAHAVRIFTTRGDWVRDITVTGESKRLGAPTGIALAGDGSCIVLDERYRRVHVYGPEGELLHTFRIATDVPGETTEPSGIAVDSDGHIYISDVFNNTILIFGRNGEYLRRLGRTGDQIDQFWSPGALFIDSRDVLYAADRMNGRIQVFQYEK